MAKHAATEEQKVYASLLDKGMKVGLVTVVVTFALYVFGVLAPVIPVEQLPNYWSLPVHEYLEKAGVHPGWSWLHLLGKGDLVNFVGIALLAGVSVICYIAIIPIFLRKKDIPYTVLAILEVLVLSLAASGLLKSGGH